MEAKNDKEKTHTFEELPNLVSERHSRFSSLNKGSIIAIKRPTLSSIRAGSSRPGISRESPTVPSYTTEDFSQQSDVPLLSGFSPFKPSIFVPSSALRLSQKDCVLNLPNEKQKVEVSTKSVNIANRSPIKIKPVIEDHCVLIVRQDSALRDPSELQKGKAPASQSGFSFNPTSATGLTRSSEKQHEKPRLRLKHAGTKGFLPVKPEEPHDPMARSVSNGLAAGMIEKRMSLFKLEQCEGDGTETMHTMSFTSLRWQNAKATMKVARKNLNVSINSRMTHQSAANNTSINGTGKLPEVKQLFATQSALSYRD